MKVGYMRVYRREQNLNLQRRVLEAAGCETVFGEKASGAKAERAELLAALEYVREGDVLVVWKLDLLGRSLKDLIGRMAANMGFETYVVADACATFDWRGSDGKVFPADEVHEVSLASLHGEFAEVVSSDRLLSGP